MLLTVWDLSLLMNGRTQSSVQKPSGGYTFLTMKAEALQGLNVQLDPAETNAESPWVPTAAGPASDVEVMVGQKSELDTPRRTRPNAEPGLMIGRLYLDNCLAASGTGTFSSGESQEVAQPRVPEPSNLTNKMTATLSVGYSRGGVIQRGAAAMGASSSSSTAPAAPRAYQPLVEERARWLPITMKKTLKTPTSTMRMMYDYPLRKRF